MSIKPLKIAIADLGYVGRVGPTSVGHGGLKPALHRHGPEVIVANRMTADLGDVAAKVYTRDLFGQD